MATKMMSTRNDVTTWFHVRNVSTTYPIWLITLIRWVLYIHFILMSRGGLQCAISISKMLLAIFHISVKIMVSFYNLKGQSEKMFHGWMNNIINTFLTMMFNIGHIRSTKRKTALKTNVKISTNPIILFEVTKCWQAFLTNVLDIYILWSQSEPK